MKSRLLAAVAIGAVFLVAPASAQVKIGILNDQSRVYADSGGKYSLEASVAARRQPARPPWPLRTRYWPSAG
jgi:branched-chain amino acid transport system substrate-binding protein